MVSIVTLLRVGSVAVAGASGAGADCRTSTPSRLATTRAGAAGVSVSSGAVSPASATCCAGRSNGATRIVSSEATGVPSAAT